MTGQDVKVTAVIMAGGLGTRFWPVSRRAKPKQFLSIADNGESLLQATARRVGPIAEGGQPLVMANAAHVSLIKEQLPAARIVTEPVGRNTAACIGLAAVHVRKLGLNPVMVVLPSDHSVRDEAALLQALRHAAQLASSQDALVTIGLRPEFPHTGYGYIQRGAQLQDGAYKVARFFEKPSLERAEQYVENGNFYWNSGMFVWRADVILAAIDQYMPELSSALKRIEAAIGTASLEAVTADVFTALESVSVDFGILEHARNCVVVDTKPLGWSDVGAWDAWADYFERDRDGNLLRGDAIAIDSHGCVVYGGRRLIATLGLNDLVIIDSDDALLVCGRKDVQNVKEIVDELKKRKREELI